MKYLTIGMEKLERDCFNRCLMNNGINKPVGGLWASPYLEGEKFESDWVEWCVDESFFSFPTIGVVFELKEDSKIKTIDSLEDLRRLTDDYPLEMDFRARRLINFELVARDYDGLFLTRKGQIETRFSIDTTLYGWDVESLLILNYDCIKNQHPIVIRGGTDEE